MAQFFAIIYIILLFFSMSPLFATSISTLPITTTSTTANSTHTIIIDTDLGIDDMQAIIYLLAQKNVHIKAITIAATGEKDCRTGMPILKTILAYLNRTDIPIACGQALPLRWRHQFPIHWQQELVYLPRIFPYKSNLTFKQYPSASRLIHKLLAQSKEKITLIALGPLTNIANVILFDQQLFLNNVNRIYFTGASLQQTDDIATYFPATKNHYATWNPYIDPLAASITFNSGIPITAFSSHATKNLSTTPLLKKITVRSPTTNRYQQLIRYIIMKTKRDPFVGDQLTAVAFLHPQLCQYWHKRITLLLSPTTDAGRTIANSRGVKIDICRTASEADFMHLFWRGTKLSNPVTNNN